MTITVNIGDADLAELLAKVEAGEDVLLVRNGTPVAKMSAVASGKHFSSLSEEQRAERRALIDQIIAERATRMPATAAEIDEWKKEGRR